MSDNVVDLESAKALKRLGAPYNTPVENRKFSRKGSERYIPVWNAGYRFWNCVFRHAKKPTIQSLRRVKKALENLITTAEHLDDYLPQLAADDLERAIFVAFLTNKVAPFVAEWNVIIAAIENGGEEGVEIRGPSSVDDIWEATHAA